MDDTTGRPQLVKIKDMQAGDCFEVIDAGEGDIPWCGFWMRTGDDCGDGMEFLCVYLETGDVFYIKADRSFEMVDAEVSILRRNVP
jgi:hypothetical protein